LQFLEQRSESGQSVVRYASDHKPKSEAGKVVLMLKAAINRDENFEVLFGIGKQRSVLAAAPTGFSDCSDRVPRKRCSYTDVHALV